MQRDAAGAMARDDVGQAPGRLRDRPIARNAPRAQPSVQQTPFQPRFEHQRFTRRAKPTHIGGMNPIAFQKDAPIVSILWIGHGAYAAPHGTSAA